MLLLTTHDAAVAGSHSSFDTACMSASGSVGSQKIRSSATNRALRPYLVATLVRTTAGLMGEMERQRKETKAIQRAAHLKAMKELEEFNRNTPNPEEKCHCRILSEQGDTASEFYDVRDLAT